VALSKVILQDSVLPASSALGFLLLNKYAYRLSVNPYFASFLIFAVILVYAGQRFIKSFQGHLPDEHSAVYQKNQRLFSVYLILLFLLTFLFYLRIAAFYRWGVLPIGVISLLYVWAPVKKWKPLRKSVYKSILVAFAWSYITTLLPGLAEGRPLSGTFLAGLARMAFVIGLVLPFDKCQTHFDAEKGLKTLPLLIKPRLLCVIYTTLWLVLYLLPEIMWQISFSNKHLHFVLFQNIWLILPLLLWNRVDKTNVWFYDLLPVAAVINLLIVDYICRSLHT
jgi:hypothetical protein